MSKIRIYELAKEVGLSSKELIAILENEFGLELASHMSVIEGENLELIREYFNELQEEKEKKQKKEKEEVVFDKYDEEYDKEIARKEKKKKES